MPQQELFFEKVTGTGRIEILKSYDQSYAREAFQNMDGEAKRRLWNSLKPEELYDAAGLPSLLVSFFIVKETANGHAESLFVSPDWPSAEAFAKDRAAK